MGRAPTPTPPWCGPSRSSRAWSEIEEVRHWQGLRHQDRIRVPRPLARYWKDVDQIRLGPQTAIAKPFLSMLEERLAKEQPHSPLPLLQLQVRVQVPMGRQMRIVNDRRNDQKIPLVVDAY